MKQQEAKDDIFYKEFLLNELKELKNKLGELPKAKVKELLQSEYSDDYDAIQTLYYQEIVPLPACDLKLEIQNILLYLGFDI